MGRLFGTDGVRGIAGLDLTVELAKDLGQAGALVLTKEKSHKPTIIVGCDTRVSGTMLANALMSGICAVGADAIYVGVAPTPAIAYLTRKYKADAGVVISASHNPAEFNGIKFFDGNGYKLPDATEDEIEELMARSFAGIEFSEGTCMGRVNYKFDALDDYIDFVVETVPVDLSGIKIVADTANGASHISSIKALRRLGAEVIAIHDQPDGSNINERCGSTHLGDLQKQVIIEGADIGVAFDGDADRMLAVDELGQVIDGDQLMAICGSFMKHEGKLKKSTIVGTVMSNLGFSIMGQKNKIEIKRAAVGDRYVLEMMKNEGYNLGGEQSGHIIFLDENTTGDGLLSALHVLQVMVATHKKLSELATVMDVMPQALVNAKVTPQMRVGYQQNPIIATAIRELEDKFNGDGRVLIRPSGTEPLVRVMIEGSNQECIDKEAQRLAQLIMAQCEER